MAGQVPACGGLPEPERTRLSLLRELTTEAVIAAEGENSG